LTLFRLQGPKETDECNLGGRAYHPHDDGYFYIDADYESVAPLLRTGGFIIVTDPAAPPVPPSRGPTTIGHVMALAKTHPDNATRAALIAAVDSVAKAAPRQMVWLKAPQNVDGFSHGGERFNTDDSGFVSAPIEAVDALTRVAGFSVVPAQPSAYAAPPENPSPSPADDPPTVADPVEVEAAAPVAEPVEDVTPVAAFAVPQLVIPSRSLAASDG
jgi:hypothetical protein